MDGVSATESAQQAFWVNKQRKAEVLEGPQKDNSVNDGEHSADSDKAKKTEREITAKYDMNNISPREIDEMVGELADHGHMNGEWMMLLAQGEEFRSRLADLAKRINGPTGATPFDPTKKIDLVADVMKLKEQSEQYGSPTEMLDRMLETLDRVMSYGANGAANIAADTQAVLIRQQESAVS